MVIRIVANRGVMWGVYRGNGVESAVELLVFEVFAGVVLWTDTHGFADEVSVVSVLITIEFHGAE